jgi:hypothetical protein
MMKEKSEGSWLGVALLAFTSSRIYTATAI